MYTETNPNVTPHSPLTRSTQRALKRSFGSSAPESGLLPPPAKTRGADLREPLLGARADLREPLLGARESWHGAASEGVAKGRCVKLLAPKHIHLCPNTGPSAVASREQRSGWHFAHS